MKLKIKKILAVFLSLAMVFTAVPLSIPSMATPVKAASVYEVDDMMALMIDLASNDERIIKLVGDIEVETDAWGYSIYHKDKKPEGFDGYIMTVNGKKTIDLNGYSIDFNSYREAENRETEYMTQTLMKVCGDLTIDDSSSDKDGYIRFHSKAWYQPKTNTDYGEYKFYDYRNVIEIMDGGKVTLNSGSIEAGRCKTQWMYGALDNYDIGDSMSGQWFNRLHGNATFVVPGNGIVINPGATFIMNGGSVTGRQVYNENAAIWLKGSEFSTSNDTPAYEKFSGKTTVIHINDGYLYGKAGASIFNRHFPFYMDYVDCRIVAGKFELGKEDKVRQLDNNGSTYYGLAMVVDGEYGNLNIPVECIKAYDAKYGVVDEGKLTVEGQKFTSLQNAVDKGYAERKAYKVKNGDETQEVYSPYYFTDVDVVTGPTDVETISGHLHARYSFDGPICRDIKLCDDALITYDEIENWWDVNENNLTVPYSADAHHSERYVWNITDGTDSVVLVTEDGWTTVKDILTQIKNKPVFYNRVLADHEELTVKCYYGEVYNGYYSYTPILTANMKFKLISYEEEADANHDWTFSGTIKEATCTESGSHEIICTKCGKTAVIEDPLLGHNWVAGKYAFDTDWWFTNGNGSITLTDHTQYHRTYKCSRCGEYSGQATHTWVTETVQPTTCLYDGYEKKYCKDCGYVSYIHTLKAAHTPVFVNTNNGYKADNGTHWHECSVCGEIYDYSKHVDSNSNGLCDVCGHSIATVEIVVEDSSDPSHASTLKVVDDIEVDFESWFDPDNEDGQKMLMALHYIYCYDNNDTSVLNPLPNGKTVQSARSIVTSYSTAHKAKLDKYDPSGTLSSGYDMLIARLKADYYSYVTVSFVNNKYVFEPKKDASYYADSKQTYIPYGLNVTYKWRFVTSPAINRLNYSFYPAYYVNDGVFGYQSSLNLGAVKGGKNSLSSSAVAFDPETTYYVELVVEVREATMKEDIYHPGNYNPTVNTVTLTSDTIKIPALTKVEASNGTCTLPPTCEHYEYEADYGIRYFSYWSNWNEGDGYFKETVGGEEIYVLTEIDEEQTINGNIPGHKYSCECDNECNVCGHIDASRVHVAADNAVLENCTWDDDYHGYKCKYCGEVIVDLDRHTFELVNEDADCGKDGHGHYVCSDCGYVDPTEIPISKNEFSHDWVLDEERTTPVGCENDGKYVYVCSVCHDEKTDVVPATGHSIVHINAALPTCVTDGTVECYECEYCHKRWLDADGNYELPAGTVFPASDEYHSFTMDCNNGCASWIACEYCGAIKEGTFTELHAHTHVAAKEPDYGVDGNIEYWYCQSRYWADATIQHSITYEETIIPALVISDGLHKASDGNWYYYRNGVVDTTKTGIVGNDAGYWYVENGKLDFNFSGVCNDNGTEYVVKYGYMSTGFYGLVKKPDGIWAYAEAGVLTYNYTGLAKNDVGWWYIKNGVIDFSYNGIGSNQTGDYRVVNGLIDFTFNGWFRDNNTAKWYYMKGGMVDKNKAGLVKKDNDYYYVSDGGINFNYTGLAENAGNTYYIKYGYLDFTFSGVVTVGNKNYTVEKGIVKK